MKQKSFGLDIGTTTMKAVWLTREKEGFLLNAVITVPTPAKGMLSESSLEQEEIAQVIRKMVADAKIETRSVNIALPENQIYTKVIEMPALSDKELSSAIYWEAEQQIPVPLEHIMLDYKVLTRPQRLEDSVKMKILLVGASKTLIQKYEKVITTAGLSIASIETEILSAIRALVMDENFPTSLIVHIGTVNTSITIVKDTMIVFTYSISTGGSAISRAIVADFGFSIQQAEEYKKIYGLSGEFGGKIGKATQPILLPILSEIKKAFVLYNENYKDNPIRQILLSGASAKLPGLAAFFTRNLGLETVVVNPWKILLDQDVPKEIIDNAPEYTIAVGLAMRENE